MAATRPKTRAPQTRLRHRPGMREDIYVKPALIAAIIAFAAPAAALAQGPADLPETRIAVTLPDALAEDASGRLLVFAQPATEQNADAEAVDANHYVPSLVAVAARDVATFGDGNVAVVDTDAFAAPSAFSELAPGDYRIQAALDRNGDYARFGRGAGDLVSAVATVTLPLSAPLGLELETEIPEADPFAPDTDDPAALQALEAARARLHDVVVESEALGEVFGAPQTIRAWVLVPRSYDEDPDRRWPVIYFHGAFSSNRTADAQLANVIATYGPMPEAMFVFLDFATLSGATEFADGVNNGPWEQALIGELIPEIDRRFRTLAAPEGRYQVGHSSGGWSTLWLQLRHPEVFGRTLSTSPDPTDFRDVIGVDITAPGANFYRDADGRERPFLRFRGQETGTVRDYARMLDVLGEMGGPFDSFDAVFSPRGPDGRPMEMFDRVTGDIDPDVVAYWRAHYDIARYVEDNAEALRETVAGRIQVVVGEQDNFRLEGSAHLLEAAFARAGVAADFTFLPDRDHNNIYLMDGDPLGRLVAYAQEAVAAD